ncbi:MAG TPA: ATP-binding protein [Thiobacillaceae bacterium]|nr:ATP-binding protein [Thiobacillaceae bacterium]
MHSIRGRLLVWQISALVLTGLLVSYLAYSLAWSGFNRVRDYTLEQIAYSILRHGVETGPDEEITDQGQFLSQIWNADGSLSYASRPAPVLPPQPTGNGVVHWEGEEWHTFTLKQGGLVIQVANTSANRAAMFGRIVPWLLLPLSVLVAGLGALIWMAVGRALAPLERVRGEIGTRDVSSLHELPTAGLPEELSPLVGALNGLLDRLRQALSVQRRFTADAAHELRTPLTAVRLQAQIAQQAPSDAERREALEQLIAGVDRATHLVEQLLQMARLEPDAQQLPFAPLHLDELTRQVVAGLAVQADAVDIDLGLGQCDAIALSGHAPSLRAMLGNLVDNALRHCPPGSRVDVELHRHPQSAELLVRDNGPGIPAAERQRVFDRFHRLAGAQAPGSGLGLAIVRQVVDLHGGGIDLEDSRDGGLLVRVRLPARDMRD